MDFQDKYEKLINKRKEIQNEIESLTNKLTEANNKLFYRSLYFSIYKIVSNIIIYVNFLTIL